MLSSRAYLDHLWLRQVQVIFISAGQASRPLTGPRICAIHSQTFGSFTNFQWSSAPAVMTRHRRPELRWLPYCALGSPLPFFLYLSVSPFSSLFLSPSSSTLSYDVRCFPPLHLSNPVRLCEKFTGTSLLLNTVRCQDVLLEWRTHSAYNGFAYLN